MLLLAAWLQTQSSVQSEQLYYCSRLGCRLSPAYSQNNYVTACSSVADWVQRTVRTVMLLLAAWLLTKFSIESDQLPLAAWLQTKSSGSQNTMVLLKSYSSDNRPPPPCQTQLVQMVVEQLAGLRCASKVVCYGIVNMFSLHFWICCLKFFIVITSVRDTMSVAFCLSVCLFLLLWGSGEWMVAWCKYTILFNL